MTEIPQPNSDSLFHADVGRTHEKYQEAAAGLFAIIDRMSDLIASSVHLEPGIEKSYKTEVPYGQHFPVLDCKDNEVDALVFEAKLHERDSAHKVWEFKFSNGILGEAERHVRGLVIKSKTGFELLLSPTESGDSQSKIGMFKKATPMQVETYYEETFCSLGFEIEVMAAGYDSFDYPSPNTPGQKARWGEMTQSWVEEGRTVPGLMENGRLIEKAIDGISKEEKSK